ncbi:MAG: hypothetical protein AAF321_10295, partial [Pseudomonadota bacterium]
GWNPFDKGEPAATIPGGTMPGTVLAEAEGSALAPASMSSFAALPAERSLNDYVADLVSAPAVGGSGNLAVLPRARMDTQVARIAPVGGLDQFAPTATAPARQVVAEKRGFGDRLKSLFGR